MSYETTGNHHAGKQHVSRTHQGSTGLQHESHQSSQICLKEWPKIDHQRIGRLEPERWDHPLQRTSIHPKELRPPLRHC